MRSTSSVPTVSSGQKWKEAVTFLRWRLFEGPGLEGFDHMFKELEDNCSTYERFTSSSLSLARVLEIGFGARPFRLLALMSMGIDARGIDLDMPMLQFSPARLFRIARKNGFERALKTGVRSALFDGRDRAKLKASLALRGYKLKMDPTRFLVGDATTYDFGSRSADLVCSDDVFEHIPPEGLQRLMKSLASCISPGGLALITPNIYSGITGGHLPEWYKDMVTNDEAKRSEPWEHLRKRRYIANSYLNCLTRADYRNLFKPYFEILDEKVVNPDLGRQWLTTEVRSELAHWSEDELFSNRVQFVLRPRPSLPA